jgi:tyrosine-specific transport protein
MLGLPLVIAAAGFIPSSLAFITCWIFMASTGLLLLEANLWFGEGIHLMTLAERTLGKSAKIFVTLCFGFLFYCLLVAYLGGGGELIAEFLGHYFGFALEPFYGSLALVLIFGVVLYKGTAEVDVVNRFLMIGLGVSYAGLVILGVPHVQMEHLKSSSWDYAIPALPAMIISFGYHNLVPSLTTYLKGNARSLRFAILVGSAIPLVFYLIWDGIILGMLASHNDIQGAIDSGSMITKLVRETVGSSYVVDFMHFFAFFALVTSFLGVSMSFVDFLADGLKIKKTHSGSLILVAMVLLPPCIFAYLYPSIFLTALNYAGAFGAVLLFGVIPVLMVWKGRYIEKRVGVRFVPGGKITLIILGAFALFVFFMQLKNELGF